MIHHYNGQAAPDASKPNWWLRLGVILLSSTLIGLLYLWLDGYFIIPFVWTATFLLCLMRGIDLTESYSPHIRFTDWLLCRCNSWRCRGGYSIRKIEFGSNCDGCGGGSY